MIHISKIPDICQNTLANGEPQPVSLKFVKESGQIVEANDVIMTSHHAKGRTINLKFPNNQFRKIRLSSIIEFQNQKTFI